MVATTMTVFRLPTRRMTYNVLSYSMVFNGCLMDWIIIMVNQNIIYLLWFGNNVGDECLELLSKPTPDSCKDKF